jgi:hypothetical protein
MARTTALPNGPSTRRRRLTRKTTSSLPRPHSRSPIHNRQIRKARRRQASSSQMVAGSALNVKIITSQAVCDAIDATRTKVRMTSTASRSTSSRIEELLNAVKSLPKPRKRVQSEHKQPNSPVGSHSSKSSRRSRPKNKKARMGYPKTPRA